MGNSPLTIRIWSTLATAGVTIGIFCVLAPSRADEPGVPVAPADLITEAQEKNPEIRALSAAIASAQGEVTTARTWDNPDLGVEPGVRYLQSSSGSSVGEFHGIFDLKQTFEFPGKRRLRQAVAEKNVAIQELALTGFRKQLSIEVRHACETLRILQQVVALKEGELTLARTFAEVARRKFAGGFAPEFEATKAEVEVIAAQKGLSEAQTQVIAARAALNTLVGRTPHAGLEIADTSDIPVTLPDETNLLQQVLLHNPSLQVQAAEVEHSGLNLKSVRKSRLPDFSIGPSIEYLKDEQTYDVGVTVPLPLWDSKKGEIASASAEQQKAVAELEKLQREIERDVTSAYHELLSARQSLALYTPEFLGKLKATLDSAGDSYATGRTGLLLYLETQRTYFDTQLDYFDTLRKLHDATADLEAAAGMPLAELPGAATPREKH